MAQHGQAGGQELVGGETDIASAEQTPPRRRTRRISETLESALWTVGLLATFTIVAELGSRLGLWRESTFPPPSKTIAGVFELMGSDQFWSDAGRTGLEIGLAILFGSTIGLLAGLTFWKLPTIGRIFEPYLVSFYAVPLVLFYPVMIVLVGINVQSVIILATIMAAIPMTLNTTVGLNSIRPVYLRLARSLQLRPLQMLTQVALPAAAPFILAGLRMAVVYALIGSIAMEFVTAQAGLGYRIRYLYEIFDNQTMHSYILVVLILSITVTVLLRITERVLVKGRRS